MTIRALVLPALVALAACSNSPTGTDPVCLNDAGVPLQVAPQSARVDLARPTFPDPTNVTHPLYPVSRLHRTLLLGFKDGVPLRAETTLLPYTKKITWDGQEVTNLVQQYVAFIGGRLHEVAIDWFSQAADGSVWYFGEDVRNYANGLVVDTEGTWIAGADGPAAMIMPPAPLVGNVWRPENICGLVFEEVTVKSVGVSLPGPRGPVAGGIVTSQLYQDGTREDKSFAPEYGEFATGAGASVEAIALAVPTDALTGPVPAELRALATGAAQVFDAAAAGNWSAASASALAMTTAWNAFRTATGTQTPALVSQMNGFIAALNTAVTAHTPTPARQASIDVARAGLDFELRYRPIVEVDLALIDLWVRQVLLDTAVGTRADLLGDLATLNFLRDRIGTDVAGVSLTTLHDGLAELERAVSAASFTRVAVAGARLKETLRAIR